MKIRTMRYMFKQGFVGLWRNRTMSMASIGSVAASLIILSVIIILVLNINNLAYLAGMQFDTIQVYLEEDLSVQETFELGQKISSLNGVRAVEYVSKEEALQRMKEDWGEEGYLLENLERNPFPNSYTVYLESLEIADEVVEGLKNFNKIEDIKYYRVIIERLLTIADLIRNVGLALILILILITIFIISNTIKITLNARRQEISIMKYVGATNWFIRWPFVIEGILLGLIGAAIALVFVYYGYGYTMEIITTYTYMIFTVYMLSVEEIMQKTIIMFIVLGSGVGALGSLFSLRKYLKV